MMSEIILQTIAEKLDHLELVVKKENAMLKDSGSQQPLLRKIGGIERELRMSASGVKTFDDKLHQLLLRLDAIDNTLHQRSSNNTIHKDHLNQGVWFSITLFVVCLLLIVMLIISYDSNKKYQSNDTKYRLLKVTAGKNLSKVLYHLDTMYDANPKGLTKQVIRQEDSLIERVRQLRWAGDRKEKQKN